jgi:hypothetical protein
MGCEDVGSVMVYSCTEFLEMQPWMSTKFTWFCSVSSKILPWSISKYCNYFCSPTLLLYSVRCQLYFLQLVQLALADVLGCKFLKFSLGVIFTTMQLLLKEMVKQTAMTRWSASSSGQTTMAHGTAYKVWCPFVFLFLNNAVAVVNLEMISRVWLHVNDK